MEFTLKLVADLDTIHDYTKGILWSIFFTRVFGHLSYTNSSFLNVSYPKINNYQELETLIDSTVNAIVEELMVQERNDSDIFVFKSLAVIKFYEKMVDGYLPSTKQSTSSNNNQSQRQSSDLFYSNHKSSSSLLQSQSSQYINCWETWNLKLNVINNRRPDMVEKLLNTTNGKRKDLKAYSDGFERNLYTIMELVDSNKEHIPAVQSMEISPFPYRILYAANTHDSSVLDDDFANLEFPRSASNNTSNPHNSTNGSIDTSLEYISTTEVGDGVGYQPHNNAHSSNDKNYNNTNNDHAGRTWNDHIRDPTGNNDFHDNYNNNNSNANNDNYNSNAPRENRNSGVTYSGEELLRNGYKFIKKLLSE